MTMISHIPDILIKHKQLVILSVAAIALAAYILPLDSLFANQATAQQSRSGDNPYGKTKQGPPASTPGGTPGERSQGQGPPEDRGPPAPRGGGGGGGPPRP